MNIHPFLTLRIAARKGARINVYEGCYDENSQFVKILKSVHSYEIFVI